MHNTCVETEVSSTSKEYRHIVNCITVTSACTDKVIYGSHLLDVGVFISLLKYIHLYSYILIPVPPAVFLGWSVLSTQTFCVDAKEDVETGSEVPRLL